MNEERKKLVVLTGPTAVGKTELSIALAKAINAEIISADSMQVYKCMDIGTAKITGEEMQGVRHYLIDEFNPDEEFNVNIFQSRCKKYMDEIYSRGKIPVIVGGTGFYIQSVLYDIDFDETDADINYRKRLERFAAVNGNEALHEELAKIDIASAKLIHPNNVKRVIRALEYYNQTGKSMAEHNENERKKTSPYNFRYYVLSLPREVLYDRINRRVDIMKESGLTEEVKALVERGCNKDMVSMKGIGYKEIISALEGEMTLDDAYEKIKLETRHFAKRQFTWFRREKDVTWLDKEKFGNGEELLKYCLDDLADAGIISKK